MIPALGGTEQGRQEKIVKASTEKHASTMKELKGSQGHWQQTDWQQIEFHWRHKWSQEKELHIDLYTERDTTGLYGASIKNVCIFEQSTCLLMT